MATFEEQILRAIQGRHPLIYLHTSEEERAIDCLKLLVSKCFPGGTLTTWSCVRGLEPAVAQVDTRDPVTALQQMIDHPRRGFYVMNDLSAFMTDPKVVRGLRETYSAFTRNYQSAVVIVSPVAVLPETIEKELCYVELAVPSPDELLAQVLKLEKQYPGTQIPANLRPQVVLALRGLTLNEVNHVLHRVFTRGATQDKILDEIFAEKESIAKKAGFLEFVPLKFDINHVGGLENVKNWAMQRKALFNQASVDAGIPVPKGILIMGISGCGKSMLAKAIANLWQLPLFRLDMSLVFSGAYGSPEAAFHRALRTIEAVAPVVLWIDEMEGSLSTSKDVGTPQALTFSAFLTWMQEKPPLVFVAATANHIDRLPAEIIRKGRFDQVFFCDLPNEEERAEILKIQLQLNGSDPKNFDIHRLVLNTEARSGAEIEQAVIAARIEALQAGRPMETEDVKLQTDRMIPLSKTMAEQVKAIRDWARTRATPASKRRADSL